MTVLPALGEDRPLPVVSGSLGILGGTFDPIHFGHLAIAEEARESLGLERVIFVPARVPPHKPDQPISSVVDRVAMVELAIADNPAFALSRIELDRDGPSYTVDTLDLLAAEARGEGRVPDLVFVMSAEAFAAILTWREPRRIVELARIAVMPRPGHAAPRAEWIRDNFAGLEDRVVLLAGPHIGLSGSEIRDRARRGRSIRYLVPPVVAGYIAGHRLYDSRPDIEPWRNDRP
ncbi:MAG TPA: nicotinate-nucleotide adenylyltransferase [Candidatus Limnocylindrales bacterium]